MRDPLGAWWIPGVVGFVLMTMVTGSLPAQTKVAESSPYKGKLVAHPEEWSGLWEASNGEGGVVGIHLLLGTMVAPDAKTDGRSLTGVEQQWESFDVGVYEQRGPSFKFGDEGYFSDRSMDAPVKLEDGRLQLHFYSRVLGGASVDLDLVKQPDDTWVGRFHRGSFDQQVVLERPGAGLKTNSRIAGTWKSAEYSSTVIHVGEQATGQFAAWVDMLQIPGTMRFGPSVQPHRLVEIYGERVRVQMAGETGVMFEFGAYSAICYPRTFAGKLASDGSSIESRSGPGAAGPFTKLTRIH